MVVPAEGDAVVGVGGAASGVFVDVVDFAPGRGDVAAGDEAFLVAEGDRAALGGGEDPVGGADADDSPVGVEQHPLHSARARGVCGDTGGDGGVDAVDVRPAATGRVVVCGDGHHQRRRTTAQAWGVVVAGGGAEDRGEGVVLLLRPRTRVDHPPRVTGREATVIHTLVHIRVPFRARVVRGAERHSRQGWSVDFGVQVRVEQALQLSRDLGQQPPPDRDDPILRAPERQPPHPHRDVVRRFRTVGIEILHDHLRQQPQILRRRRRSGIINARIRLRARIRVSSRESARVCGQLRIGP